MLESLDEVPWSTLEHAYGTAEDVPNLIRKLLQSDEKVREDAWYHLYGNVFHQGTRYPATPYVIPFLIEMCASPEILKRGDILSFWGSLITGYFSIQERPCWGDGDKIHWYGQVQVVDNDDPYARALHQIYLESLRGYKLLCKLLVDEEKEVRMGAAWMFACLPTLAETSVTILLNQLKAEASGWVRAAIAFALGELGVSPPLHQILNEDTFSAARCMAACELVRIEPSAALIEPLLHFVAEPIEGYERIPGAGGKSTGDAAFSISYLPEKIQQKAIPAICDRLDQSRAFDTMPLVNTLLSAAFAKQEEPLTELNDLQQRVLRRMVDTEELWSIGNLWSLLESYGLPHERKKCGKLVKVKVADDEALTELRWALSYSEMNFLEKARQGIDRAISLDPAVFERAQAPDECWLLYAKAIAETDPEMALSAYRKAIAINPSVALQVRPSWRLSELL